MYILWELDTEDKLFPQKTKAKTLLKGASVAIWYLFSFRKKKNYSLFPLMYFLVLHIEDKYFSLRGPLTQKELQGGRRPRDLYLLKLNDVSFNPSHCLGMRCRGQATAQPASVGVHIVHSLICSQAIQNTYKA